MQVVVRMNPRKLTSHPLNATLYDEVVVDDFVASIKKEGVLTPLIITPKNVIVSGHRRQQAAVIAKLRYVPCIIHEDLKDPLAIEEALIQANKQREKTAEQKTKEFKRLKEIEAKRDKKRLKTSTGGANPRPTVNLQEAGNGEASEKAAAAVGMSRRTAEKASTVVKAIDEAEASGNTETAEDLRQTLNEQSVSAAYRKVTEPPTQSVVLDALGCPIPDHLVAQHRLAAELRSLAAKDDPIKRAVEEMAARRGAEYMGRVHVLELLTQVKGLIRDSRYFTECPVCRGSVDESCHQCKGNGYLPFARKGTMSAADKEWLAS